MMQIGQGGMSDSIYVSWIQLVSMKKKTSVLWHLLLIAALDMPLVLFDPVKTLH